LTSISDFLDLNIQYSNNSIVIAFQEILEKKEMKEEGEEKEDRHEKVMDEVFQKF